ncbi:radical SAM protein [Cellulomonas wangsupingiae]|uniref:Radical SAM protein n=1 Tax=Cellulomonas wangsupingiae TaxID=2968085 RepID=A0ABY5KAZ3_9CELL|nr:radical SAM protein [Cellulomonas wangsupingiae]MCC2335093.1 radical SAM protein [Cellulomonas wangsupingiae]UUI65588.1 radical SAM protein [Cellulomonas wangsupingiae]
MPLHRSRYAHVLSSPARTVAFNSLTLESWELAPDDVAALQDPGALDVTSAQAQELLEAGLVVHEDEAPGTAIARLNELRMERAQRRGGRFATLRIALTERCNMACGYCFQQALYPDAQPRMDLETFEREMSWFIDQARGENVTIQYFGGEPMMEWALIQRGDEMLREALSAGLVSEFRQTMTTNGTVMTAERAAWLAEHDFDLIMSFDGPPAVNDQLRVFKNGRGTYDKAARGLRLWTEAGGRGAILMTATELNLPHLPTYVRWFLEESGLPIETVALNSPQPTATGWETGGVELATAVFDIWTYCRSKDVEFHGPGTFIPSHIRTGVAQTDHCVDGDLLGDGEGSWPIYVSASGERSLCLVHHNDHRVQTTPEDSHARGREWHLAGPSSESCDGCVASQMCGGPCTLEKLLWGPKLSADRCDFVRTMTTLVLTEG